MDVARGVTGGSLTPPPPVCKSTLSNGSFNSLDKPSFGQLSLKLFCIEYLHIEDTITPLVGETAELSEGETKWFLCTHTTSVGESRSIQWTSQVQRELNYINLTGDKLVNAAITDQLCENMNGSVLVAGFPEEIVRSEQHDGAYVSVQQSLLVFCAAQSSMTGIYICSDDSIQVRQVDVCVGSCPTLPQQTKEFDVTATLILVISCVLVMLVCVMIGLSVITWKYRNEKSAPGWLHKKTHLNMKELGIE